MEFKRVCAYSTFRHYGAHVWPIIEALRERGVNASAFSSRRDVEWGEYLHPSRARKLDGTLWLVAGSVDSTKLAGLPQVYVEHGAGQAYEADVRGQGSPSYSTGVIGDARLFLCPNFCVAERRRKRQPGVPAVTVGAPILDEYVHMIGQPPDDAHEQVAAMAFHWDCTLVPESRSAFDHYASSFVKINLALRRRGIVLVGHAHPRIAARARAAFGRAGIEWWEADEVMARASVLAIDNSSFGFEFASLGRPTVWMNAPWYRRDVHHGLRFWECIPGEQVDDPVELPGAIEHAMFDPAHETDVCLNTIYPLLDGKASARAADAIMLLM